MHVFSLITNNFIGIEEYDDYEFELRHIFEYCIVLDLVFFDWSLIKGLVNDFMHIFFL